eukprot:1603634-Rhodomonas_salina.1
MPCNRDFLPADPTLTERPRRQRTAFYSLVSSACPANVRYQHSQRKPASLASNTRYRRVRLEKRVPGTLT